jgi:hypothetical protein
MGNVLREENGETDAIEGMSPTMLNETPKTFQLRGQVVSKVVSGGMAQPEGALGGDHPYLLQVA